MEQYYLCACCGEENDIFLDPAGGDLQEFVEDCQICCEPNVINARFNYYSREYDLEVHSENVG
jgi:hypothetical protein